MLLIGLKLASSNQKHYPDLGSDVCMGLEGMCEIHASRSRRFNCLLPAFIRCRLLISQDGDYFCGDVSFFVIVFDINGENISCAKKFLEA